MKILLDECVPWPLTKHLVGHSCTPVQRCGWAGIKNGELLLLAESQFELFLTSDQSLACQQTLKGRKIAILLLSTNKLRRLINGVNLIQTAIVARRPGEYLRLEIP